MCEVASFKNFENSLTTAKVMTKTAEKYAKLQASKILRILDNCKSYDEN